MKSLISQIREQMAPVLERRKRGIFADVFVLTRTELNKIESELNVPKRKVEFGSIESLAGTPVKILDLENDKQKLILSLMLEQGKYVGCFQDGKFKILKPNSDLEYGQFK